MRVGKTRVFDVAVLAVAFALPSCSLITVRRPAKTGSGWLDKTPEALSAEPNPEDNSQQIYENTAMAPETPKAEAPKTSEAEKTAAPQDGVTPADETATTDEQSDGSEDEFLKEVNLLKATLPEAENSLDHVRVLLVSNRLHDLEPKEDHWLDARQQAEQFLGAGIEPGALEKKLKERLLNVQKERRAAEQNNRKDRGEHKLAAEKRSLMDELNKHQGRALSASVHVTVLDEERGRLTAKLEEGRTPDLLSQLKKANENKEHWQKIVAAEKSETDRINLRLTEINSALKGREQDLSDAKEQIDSARGEEAELRRDLKLLPRWKAEYGRRMRAERKNEKEQDKLSEKIMTSPPPDESKEIVPEKKQFVATEVRNIEKKPLRPEDIQLTSFDFNAPLDEILSQFPEPSHQRAVLNLLIWKMTSNDPRRGDAMKRLAALRGKGATSTVKAAAPEKNVDVDSITERLFAPQREMFVEKAADPVRKTAVVPRSARQRLLSGSEKMTIAPNTFNPADRKTTENIVKTPASAEHWEKKTAKVNHSAVTSAGNEPDESPAISLNKLMKAPPPEKWQVTTQPDEKLPAPPRILSTEKRSAKTSESSVLVYLVKNGDTLPSLAKQIYGDPSRWQEIYEANQNVILKGLLEPGQWLLIPKGMAR